MNIEFYMDSLGVFKKTIYMKIDGASEWREFDQLSELETETIFDHLVKIQKMRVAFLHLSHHYRLKREILKQFILCNWVKLDNVLDIADKHVSFENIACHLKGTGSCPFGGEGIVCIKH